MAGRRRNAGPLHGAGPAAVLACWACMIPYLSPEMPKRQREALQSLVKTPLVYTTVALSDWRAFKALGIASVYAPGAYHHSLRLNAVVDIDGYKSVRSPDEPILVRMTRTPCQPGLEPRAQFRAGQRELLAADFETFERNIRDQLARILAPGGFDPARDIVAITVNRWPHGYAYEYNPLLIWLGRARPAPRCRPGTLRPHRYREFGLWRRGLYRRRHRAGLARNRRGAGHRRLRRTHSSGFERDATQGGVS